MFIGASSAYYPWVSDHFYSYLSSSGSFLLKINLGVNCDSRASLSSAGLGVGEFSLPMNNMLKHQILFSQRCAQKGGMKIDLRKLGSREPTKFESAVAFNTEMRVT